MKITSFTKPKGLITISAALILMIDPNIILHLLGAQLEAAGVMMTRILGGAYLVSGIGIWSINAPVISAPGIPGYTHWASRRGGLCLPGCVYRRIELLGWVLAFAYVLFVCGFVFVALETRRLNVSVYGASLAR